MNRMPATNFSYPSGAAAVVFGGQLSACAAFRIDRKSPAIIFVCSFLKSISVKADIGTENRQENRRQPGLVIHDNIEFSKNKKWRPETTQKTGRYRKAKRVGQ
jgi:hypothetical protein